MNEQVFVELLAEVAEQGNVEMELRAYSGRGMYGKQCVAVNLRGGGDLWNLALELAEINNGGIDLTQFGHPHTDSLGMGEVAYWPQIEWSEEYEQFVHDEEY